MERPKPPQRHTAGMQERLHRPVIWILYLAKMYGRHGGLSEAFTSAQCGMLAPYRYSTSLLMLMQPLAVLIRYTWWVGLYGMT